MVEEETQRRVELIIKKKVDFILESRKQEIEDEINKRVSLAARTPKARCLVLYKLEGAFRKINTNVVNF